MRVRSLSAALVLASGLVAGLVGPLVRPAFAFDFFGLFGSEDPPKPSPTALPYAITFEVKGDDAVQSSLQDASTLYRLRQDAPPDGDTLVQRVNADFPPLIDALWGQGYYNARVTIEVAGVPLQIGEGRDAAATRAANALRNREPVPVKVVAETGPEFKLRTIRLVDGRTRMPLPPDDPPARILKLDPGDPARSSDLRAATARVTDYFRGRAHPLVKVPPPEPVVDHATETMDVTYLVDPGPVAGIGPVTVKGPERFPQEVVRSFIYLRPGEPYSPKRISDTRKSIASIPAVGSVRIREATALDPDGNLPIFIDVTDRAPNLFGFSAGYSTVDGPQGRVFYENRNLFGGAERLRLEGAGFLAPRVDGSRIKSLKDITYRDIGGRFTVSFLKPALDGSRVDFLFDGIVERNRVGGGRFGGYTDRLGGGTAALQYRADDNLSFLGGLKYERGQTSDVISAVDYQLVGVPLTVKYDTTDKPLDPSTGFRIAATVTPYPTFLGSSVGFTRATVNASAYYALDDDGRYVLAARGGFGSLVGGPDLLSDIPSNYRFFEGGATSVRGYRLQTIGPHGPFGFTVGGRSSFDASVEARVKITENIGIAPFMDIGGAFLHELPGGRGGDTRASAGLGVFYVTPIGPIRLDVAAPLNPRRGDQPVVLYVSIGQSF